jgi:hypothetical protein
MTPNTSPHPYYPLVTLTDDPQFRGYAFGRYYDAAGRDTGCLCVSVSQPGSTGLRGCQNIPLKRIEVIE